jgi:TrmH family RNA methyltransferase
LQNKKYRKIEHAFLVEGLKNVSELLRSDFEILRVFCSERVADELHVLTSTLPISLEIVSEKDLSQMGSLENNQTALAVARMKDDSLPETLLSENLTLLLDNINDPGNLGTIIRMADWYGIKNMICSTDTVDLYNPKVINATKGSFARVNVAYRELSPIIEQYPHANVYAACLEGESIYTVPKRFPAFLIVGNESNGIRTELLGIASQKVHIPRRGTAESLNVGVATGILIDRLLGES